MKQATADAIETYRKIKTEFPALREDAAAILVLAAVIGDRFEPWRGQIERRNQEALARLGFEQ